MDQEQITKYIYGKGLNLNPELHHFVCYNITKPCADMDVGQEILLGLHISLMFCLDNV